MKAIILAAGIGSRLRPETNKKPKCLININGKPILYYQLKAFESARFDEVILVTGYLSNKIREFLETSSFSIPVVMVENKRYKETNNMFSLFLALNKLKEDKELDDEFVVCNGDVVFEKELIKLVVNTPGNAIFVDRSQYLEESMKVTVDKLGKVSDISKSIKESHYYGVSIDLYKLNSEGIKQLKECSFSFINKGKKNLWTEVAIQKLIKNKTIKFYPKDITGFVWWEIDTICDIKRAEYRLKLKDGIKLILQKEIYAFDLDGTVISGSKQVKGAIDFITLLESLGKAVSFITNNTSMDNDGHRKRLANILGIDIKKEAMYSALDHMKEYLESKKISRIFPVLNNEAISYLGCKIDEQSPDLVVVGFDTELNYEKLVKACLLIQSGIPFVITNPDARCPVGKGFIPDSGSIGNLVKDVTGKKPHYIGGKPNPNMIRKLAKHYNCSKNDVCYFGDRLYTDIKMGEKANALSVLMLTGETKFEDLCLSERYKKLMNSKNVFLGENFIFLRRVAEKHLTRIKSEMKNVL